MKEDLNSMSPREVLGIQKKRGYRKKKKTSVYKTIPLHVSTVPPKLVEPEPNHVRPIRDHLVVIFFFLCSTKKMSFMSIFRYLCDTHDVETLCSLSSLNKECREMVKRYMPLSGFDFVMDFDDPRAFKFVPLFILNMVNKKENWLTLKMKKTTMHHFYMVLSAYELNMELPKFNAVFTRMQTGNGLLLLEVPHGRDFFFYINKKDHCHSGVNFKEEETRKVRVPLRFFTENMTDERLFQQLKNVKDRIAYTQGCRTMVLFLHNHGKATTYIHTPPPSSFYTEIEDTPDGEYYLEISDSSTEEEE